MLFYGTTTIPANTTKESPLQYTIPITKGIVKKLGVYFPWGCAGLTGIQIMHYTWQLTPLSRTEWLIGNDLLIETAYDYEINVEPFFLVVRGYNLDDTYSHTPLVFIHMSIKTITANLQRFLDTL